MSSPPFAINHDIVMTNFHSANKKTFLSPFNCIAVIPIFISFIDVLKTLQTVAFYFHKQKIKYYELNVEKINKYLATVE